MAASMTESVLSILVSGCSGPGEVVRCLGGILCHDLTLEIFLAQLIGGVVVLVTCGILQPLHPNVGSWTSGSLESNSFPSSYCAVACPCYVARLNQYPAVSQSGISMGPSR